MYSMPSVTIAVGLILAAYGGYSYSISESQNKITALIPSFFGAGFVILGLIAMKDNLRKHAMHAAAALGLLGFLGGAAMGFPKLPDLVTEKLDAKEANKAKSQNLLAFVCIVFVGMCVNSFIQARKARDRQSDGSSQIPK